MKRVSLIISFILVGAANVLAQSDEQLIDTVRSSAAAVFLEQASWVLPDSFHNSEFTESYKEGVVLQLANDTADCLADKAVEYAAKYDVPIAEFVSSDGTIHFDGESGLPYSQLLDPCIRKAWQVAGISLE